MTTAKIKQEEVNGHWVSTVEMPKEFWESAWADYRYETMIFAIRTDGSIDFVDLWCERCNTIEEALGNHTKAVEQAKRYMVTGEGQ